MATIRTETGRGVRILAQLTAGQTFGLLLTAAAAWAVWSSTEPGVARAVLAAGVAAVGGAYTVGRWPLGGDGERVALWLARLARFAWERRAVAGAAAADWAGVSEVVDGVIRQRGGGAAVVLECRGGDPGLQGPEAAPAARVAYGELLHACDRPLQVVGEARWVSSADRPPLWDPRRAPAGLATVAAAYAGHWEEVVASRRAVVRRCLLVLSVSPEGAGGGGRQSPLEAAARRFGARTGLRLRRLAGPELIAVLRQGAGAADPRPGPDPGDGYRVGGPRG